MRKKGRGSPSAMGICNLALRLWDLAKVQTVKKEPTRHVGAVNSTKSVEVKKEGFESLPVGSVNYKYNMKKTEWAPSKSKTMEKESARSKKVVKSEDSSETNKQKSQEIPFYPHQV